MGLSRDPEQVEAAAQAALRRGLSGTSAHVATATVFDGLPWELAGRRPEGAPYTVFQLLNHMIYWQEYFLAEIRGTRPAEPAHWQDSWPGPAAPASEAEWRDAVERFRVGLEAAEAEAGRDLAEPLRPRPDRTRGDRLASIATHNSYHAGQVALLRRQLGSWPPPGGGDTW
ncbi:MAG: DinB family protein [Clostridia bacterium]|nr:DinB family protein [Clostridia bacterium]